MSKKVKVIKEIKKNFKITEVKKEHQDKPQDLEKALEKDAGQQFQEFVSTGVAPTPTLSTGQTQQRIIRQITQPLEATRQQAREDTRFYDATGPTEEQLTKTYNVTPSAMLSPPTQQRGNITHQRQDFKSGAELSRPGMTRKQEKLYDNDFKGEKKKRAGDDRHWV